MSSKLLPGGAAGANAIQWRPAPGEPASAGGPHHPPAHPAGDAAALENRIRMLEAELAARVAAARQQAQAEA
ncbi:MAG: hypothetical protein K2X35_26110, partial [Bryobacteraceae bacterium]|nr:hypothetical protein [Bryobacteraceae bacterium]